MRHWQRLLASTAIFTVSAMVTSSAPMPASAEDSPPPPTAEQEALRTKVQGVLSGLEQAVGKVESDPALAKALASTGADPAAKIAAAEEAVAAMTSDQLATLEEGLSADPGWDKIGSTLSGAVGDVQSAPKGPVAAKAGATFTDDCSTVPSASSMFLATFIANQVQSAAQALMFAVPGVIALFFFDVPTGVKIALAVVWGVTNAIYLALAQTLAVSTDCEQTVVDGIQEDTRPTDPTNPSVNVRISSEISVLNLISLAGDTATQINNVLNTVTVVDGQADTITTALHTLNNTLSAPTTGINDRVSEVRQDLQLLKTNVDVLKNTELANLTAANLEIARLDTFQTLQLRMVIEENLTKLTTSSGPMGVLQLPASKGGYLDIVKTIVVDTIAKETALGRGNPAAAVDMATANKAYTAGQYKTAYTYYGKAYQDVR